MMRQQNLKLTIGLAALLCLALMPLCACDSVGSALSTTQEAQSGQNAAAQGTSDQSADKATSEKADSDSSGSKDSKGASSKSASRSTAASSSSSSDSDSSSKPSSTKSTTSATDSNTITVKVSITSSAAGGSVSASRRIELEKGATAYDALKQLADDEGITVNARSSQLGIYVAAIGGLAEKDYGGESGWKYKVNDTTPSASASAYILKSGDTLIWYYALQVNG